MSVFKNMKALLIFALVAGVCIFILGTILHFIPTSVGSQWITLKDESIWSHQYMLEWPYFITSIVLWSVFRTPSSDLYLSQFYGNIVGFVLMPALFLLYTRGDFDNHILVVDIFIFVVAITIAQIVAYYTRFDFNKIKMIIGIVLSIVLLVVMILFSYFPPGGILFEDPTH